MTIRVGKTFYYDIGLRDGDTILPKIVRTFNEDHPRFLEDFIEFYGKGKIRIISYGDLKDRQEEIDNLLE